MIKYPNSLSLFLAIASRPTAEIPLEFSYHSIYILFTYLLSRILININVNKALPCAFLSQSHTKRRSN